MANVLFKRGSTATINSTAISDGQLLYNTTTGQHYIDSGSTRKEVGKPVDTALSKTSTNAIANKAITNSIINTTAEVNAITADNIPCGTKPVKELITSLNGSLDNIDIRYNSTTQMSEWSVRGADTWNPFSKTLSSLVPMLTDNTNVIYSSIYPGTNPYNAFNDTTLKWAAATTAEAYLGYIFTTATKVLYATLNSYDGWTLTVKLQYSDNGTTWYDASGYSTPATTVIIKSTEYSAHRYWRIYYASGDTGNTHNTLRLMFLG